MNDDRVRALAARLEPRWGPERAAAIRGGLERRARGRRLRWLVASAGALAACATVILLLIRSTGAADVAPRAAVEPGPSAAASATSASPAPASATPLVDGTDLAPGPDGDGRSFVLRAGKARFVVAHDPAHPFRVHAGPLVVEDLGTVFVVAVTIDGVAVEVQEGTVRVHRGDVAVDVVAGERRDFAAEDRAPAGGREAHPPATAPAPPSRWRELAESGRYDDAYQALRAAGPGAVRDDTTELLVAADAARLGGHPADAVPYLRRVVLGHARDPRASLAAFTLGRVLLDELGRPAEAADAFDRARAAGGAMAEDALAREVEAWSKAGDPARARALANEYARTYPAGRRARAVEKFGGAP
jgi:transmembrane sensor